MILLNRLLYMNKKFCILTIFIWLCVPAFSQLKLSNLRCENLTNPLGVDVTAPQFSWEIASSAKNMLQSAYEIRVKGPSASWNSGKIASAESVHVPYQGTALGAGEKYFWQVRIWDNQGKSSPWSEAAYFQMGLLQPSDWKAQWIEPGYEEDTLNFPSPLFRKEFSASKKISSATAFITSHGLYEGFINGKKIGNSFLTPGWTSFSNRLQYQQYDVTSLLAQGGNAIGVALGNGWYRGYLVWKNHHEIYGKTLALLFQLQIKYADGTSEIIGSGNSWKSSTAAVRYSELYHGETYDARQEQPGWSSPKFDDAKWSGVTIKNYDNKILLSTHNETVKSHETLHPIKIIKTPAGETVLDFGQNMVGFVQVKASGKAGDSITLYHAEILDKKGNFYTENLRLAKQSNVYILKGNGTETFQPHFTFQGFRYVKIEGYPGELNPENFTGYVLYSDMKPTGTFSTDNSLVNQLQHNIQWGQKGNFLDIPTDCPQRDERLGWTGDAQAFSRTATFNFAANSFFDKWLRDVAADQFADGSVPFVIPDVLGPGNGGSAGWADAATIIPWNMYLAYGDKRVLETQYESMKKWIGFMQSRSTDNLWNKGFHFGDWLFYRPDDDNDGRAAITDKYMIAQCFYAHSVQLMINTAGVLGKKEDADKYSSLLNDIKVAYRKEYMTPGGRLVSSTQTAYVLALNFDMLPEELRKSAADRLVANIKDYDGHLTTGFLGTPYLCPVLTRFGHNDVAYSLLMQKTYPSWLYPVTMGATTIWERWDGQKPDSTFQTPSMNSFNHYAYGAIGDWLYRSVAGLDTYDDQPGYKHSVIKPHPGDSLNQVNADYKTNYGMLSSHWKKEGGSFYLTVEIPSNTTSTVFIPATAAESVKEISTGKPGSPKLQFSGLEDGYVKVELGSGKYQFSSALK
jgi:alpha-L-rhamnosidase